MAGYLVLGAGKFGRLALLRLAGQDTAAVFWVVDRAAGALAALRVGNHPQVHLVEGDAVDFLQEHLQEEAWDWIIPMVPVHVAASYLAGVVGPVWEATEVPDAVGEGLPLVLRGRHGELYLSRATHRCPDDCPEPDSACPVSGEIRERPLYEDLDALKVPGFEMLVLSCCPLAPGVGGYHPGQLLALESRLASCQEKVMVATACRCHGVVHGLARRE
jgi:hypothetical protein